MLYPIDMTRLLLIVFASLLSATYEAAAAAETHHQASTAPMKVQGEVVDVGTDLIVVKTPTAKFTLKRLG